MTPQSPETVFKAYIEAFAARDFARVRACLSSENFNYHSPVSTHSSADDFVVDIMRIGQILDGIDCRRLFVDGNQVCAILNFKIRINILDITPVVLWATIEQGKIVTLEAFFDATEYSEMFPERGR